VEDATERALDSHSGGYWQQAELRTELVNGASQTMMMMVTGSRLIHPVSKMRIVRAELFVGQMPTNSIRH